MKKNFNNDSKYFKDWTTKKLKQEALSYYDIIYVVECFGTKTHSFIECYYCDFKKVLLDAYRHGLMENNKDESRSGFCPNCDRFIVYDCNYDDGAHVETFRNAIGIGYYFGSYNRKWDLKDITDEEVEKIIQNKQIYQIETPKKSLNRCSLGEYVNKQIENS